MLQLSEEQVVQPDLLVNKGAGEQIADYLTANRYSLVETRLQPKQHASGITGHVVPTDRRRRVQQLLSTRKLRFVLRARIVHDIGDVDEGQPRERPDVGDPASAPSRTTRGLRRGSLA